MEKIILVLAIIALISVSFADSDATGILAGSTEKIEFSYTNSTGVFDKTGVCALKIFDSLNNTIVNVATLSSNADGRFYYSWVVPNAPGIYSTYVNCTNPSKDNATFGGGFFVVSRQFEKAVAHAEIAYSDRYASLGTGTESKVFGWSEFIAVFIIAFVVGFFSYSLLSRGSKGL
jgi:hypothetical protein